MTAPPPDDTQDQIETQGEDNSEVQQRDVNERPCVEEESEDSTKKNGNIKTEMNQDSKNANDGDAQFGNLVANCFRESNLSMVQKLALQGEILGLIASKIK